uniref:Uncharacterized protein n=1 Tax=Anguilla anguilla TaxID=7936 RepID=A0A0E9TT02_ANGAN
MKERRLCTPKDASYPHWQLFCILKIYYRCVSIKLSSV